jgi:hypothetical protein
MRASRGAPSNTCWIRPGTPTHSKISAGFSAGSKRLQRRARGFFFRRHLGVLGPCCVGLRALQGSTTTSAPSFSASARRAGE